MRTRKLSILLISLIVISLFPSDVFATVETRYFVTSNGLALSQTGGEGDSVMRTYTGDLTCYVGIRVWRLLANATEIEITSGTPVAIVTWSTSDSSWHTESATWNCSETTLLLTDKIKTRVYQKGGTGSWVTDSTKEKYQTEALSTTILNLATWTVYYSVFRQKISTKTYWTFGWDASPWLMSRIAGFTYGVASSAVQRTFTISETLTLDANNQIRKAIRFQDAESTGVGDGTGSRASRRTFIGGYINATDSTNVRKAKLFSLWEFLNLTDWTDMRKSTLGMIISFILPEILNVTATATLMIPWIVSKLPLVVACLCAFILTFGAGYMLWIDKKRKKEPVA